MVDIDVVDGCAGHAREEVGNGRCFGERRRGPPVTDFSGCCFCDVVVTRKSRLQISSVPEGVAK